MKIIATGKLDVTKIPKDKLYVGKKGTYMAYKIYIDTDEADQFGNHGGLSFNQSKEEREAGEPKIYLGNHKITWTEGGDEDMSSPAPQTKASQPEEVNDGIDDLPF